MLHTLTVDLPCPTCDVAVTATVSPTDARDGNPGWEVADIYGCPHAEDLGMDQDFLDVAIAAAEEDLARAYDDAMEQKGDRARDGD